MSLADSAVWSGSSSLMNRSSAKPLHDPSTFDPLSAVKGAHNIMDSEWCLVAQFPAFKGPVEGPRENAWRIMSKPCFHHESELILSRVPAKTLRFAISVPSRGLSLEHLFACLLHRFSLCAQEGVAHVGERVQMG